MHATADLIRVFGRIGLLSFGGPAAQIALMQRELVDRLGWLSEAEFLRALSFCMMLPGPEAMQLATYAGWRQRGVTGGLIAGGLFVLPGAMVIAALALAYGAWGDMGWMRALFLGVQATVVVIVVQALIRLARRALTTPLARGLALAAFLALAVFHLPFPLVIFAAAFLGAALAPRITTAPAPRLPLAPSLRALAIGLPLWLGPVALLWLADATFLARVGSFFATLAVVTFGGAYAVLAYMTQTVVGDLGWLTHAQMLDALGLAETTPGPLILVTQFVAMLAGQAQGGIPGALAAGATALWVTFVPCFIWIFAGAPLIETLATRPRLQAALAGISAAVVGVIAALALWFGLHVLFAEIRPVRLGPALLELPVPATLRPAPLALAGVAAALLFWRGWDIPAVLAICAALALGLSRAGLA